MIKKIHQFFSMLREAYSLRLEKISYHHSNLFFHIRDYTQLQPYTLSAEQITNFKIIANLKATDAYVIGYMMHYHNGEQYKYSKLVHHHDLTISLKTHSSLSKNEISGYFWELIEQPELLENCKDTVLRSLIYYAYRLGRKDSIAQYQAYLKKDEENKKATKNDNILKFHRK